MTGTIIDTGEENRIEFLIEMAEYAQSIEFLSLAAKVAYRLISHWGDRVPDFGAVRRLLQEIRARNWVMANRGHELYRALLEGMLGEIRCARAWDWVDLLALAAEAHDWTTDYQAKVESEFKNYCDEGVIDDRHNCSTVDDMSSLIDALTDLGRRTGKDFEYDIDLLSGTIAEREADKLEATENDETPGTSFAAPAIVTTDDDIRQMFLTLTLEESDLL